MLVPLLFLMLWCDRMLLSGAGLLSVLCFCCTAAAGVLHTILFNRSVGQVKPVDVDSELFDITYVSVPNRSQQLLCRSGGVELCQSQ